MAAGTIPAQGSSSASGAACRWRRQEELDFASLFTSKIRSEMREYYAYNFRTIKFKYSHLLWCSAKCSSAALR